MRHLRIGIVGIVGIVAGVLLSACGAKAPEDAQAAEGTVVAPVRVAAIVREELAIPIVASGTVGLAAAGTQLVAAPGDCRVLALLVAPGQVVAAGAALATLEPSPEIVAQQAEAVAVRAAAQRDLDQAQTRLAARLATRQELGLAQAALEVAEVRLAASARRLAAAGAVASPVAGQVARVAAQPGQLVAAGAVLVEVVVPGHLEARLGLDPVDAQRIAPGQRVLLTPVRRGPPAPALELVVATLAAQLTAETRLRDALVPIPDQAGLVPGDYVSAELPRQAPAALVVPRAALVAGDDGWAIFTVRDGKAARHAVAIAAENRERAALAGAGFAAGDQVVVEGAASLADGMAVVIAADAAAAKPGDAADAAR